MQRLILIGGLVFVLLLGGGGFGFYQYKQNRPDQSYLPIPFNTDAPESAKQDAVKNIRTGLFTDKILSAVAKDCDAKGFFNAASDSDAVAQVRQRAFAEIGTDANSSGVKYSSLRVGFRGKRKEMPILKKLTERLGKEIKLSQPDSSGSEF